MICSRITLSRLSFRAGIGWRISIAGLPECVAGWPECDRGHKHQHSNHQRGRTNPFGREKG
ncbi:hypothetical protein RBSWK_04294 [Rhodopirellula baltica SWK14]|uniref:Uncharacterized protein n=1 Tax=Rhodopirellula baltica SWK14 TaxID=993516 RepID=L7CCP4_RHOBT|nr:hypothetical protein RBSWK_04294 [Rhodopirellula baltica SWK14]